MGVTERESERGSEERANICSVEEVGTNRVYGRGREVNALIEAENLYMELSVYCVMENNESLAEEFTC